MAKVHLYYILSLIFLIFGLVGFGSGSDVQEITENQADSSQKSKRSLGSQWQWGGHNPWGAPKPKITTIPAPIVPQELNIIGEMRDSTNCTMKSFSGIYFYGKLNAVVKNVENFNICVGVCWHLRQKGRQCGSVNYLKKQQKCEIMDDVLLGQKSYMLPFLAESDQNSVYMVLVGCENSNIPSTTPNPPSAQPESEIPSVGSCGRTFIEPRISNSILNGRSSARIVGGSEARPHSFPWIVAFEEFGEQFCGGTLIRVSPRAEESDIVVTASHCLQDNPNWLKLILGEHDKDNPSSGHRMLDYAQWVMHPDYDRGTVLNDIAIVKLIRPVQFSRTIQPACLPEYGENVQEGLTAIVAGWGTMQEGSDTTPSVLMQVPVLVQNHDLCANELYPGEVYSPEMFCAGHLEGERDSCQGDSGGPLIFKTSKGWTLRGVVSFGDGCARAGKPGVYTNVSNYIPWIRETMEKISDVKL